MSSGTFWGCAYDAAITTAAMPATAIAATIAYFLALSSMMHIPWHVAKLRDSADSEFQVKMLQSSASLPQLFPSGHISVGRKVRIPERINIPKKST
jgi:hypothetical protein